MGIGEILSTAFQLYQRHWRTLLAIAAVVVVPFTLLQYLFGDLIRARGEETANGVVIETASWAVGIAGLVTALAALLMFLVLTGAITRAVAAEVAGEDPGAGRGAALSRPAGPQAEPDAGVPASGPASFSPLTRPRPATRADARSRSGPRPARPMAPARVGPTGPGGWRC
jgi:hypothetical protein